MTTTNLETPAVFYPCDARKNGGYRCHHAGEYAVATDDRSEGRLSCRQHLAKVTDELLAAVSAPAKPVLKIVKFTPPIS